MTCPFRFFYSQIEFSAYICNLRDEPLRDTAVSEHRPHKSVLTTASKEMKTFFFIFLQICAIQFFTYCVCIPIVSKRDADSSIISMDVDHWLMIPCSMPTAGPILAIQSAFERMKEKQNKRPKRSSKAKSAVKGALRGVWLTSLCLASPVVVPSIWLSSWINGKLNQIKNKTKKIADSEIINRL